MYPERKVLQSTQSIPDEEEDEEKDVSPLSESPNTRTNDVYYSIINSPEITTGYMDLIGRFPKRPSRGNEHTLFSYHFDANHVRAVHIKNIKGSTIVEACKKLQSTFEQASVAPETYVLDNETSCKLLDAFEEQDVDYQLVPPHNHRNNQAELSMQTLKKISRLH